MTSAELLAEVRASGHSISVAGERLYVEPRPAPELRERIVAQREELLGLLRQETGHAPFDPATREPPDPSVWPEGTFPVEPFIVALEEVERTGKLDFWQSDLDRRVAAPRPCHMCGSRRWWRLKNNGLGAPGVLVCPVCHPPMRRPDEIEWLDVAEDVR